MVKHDIQDDLKNINETLGDISTNISNLDSSSKFLREEERHAELMSQQHELNSKHLGEQNRILTVQIHLLREQKRLTFWTMILAIATIILVVVSLIMNSV